MLERFPFERQDPNCLAEVVKLIQNQSHHEDSNWQRQRQKLDHHLTHRHRYHQNVLLQDMQIQLNHRNQDVQENRPDC
jgi:hypothetical protein